MNELPTEDGKPEPLAGLKPRVLLVDDEDALLRAMTRILAAGGLDVFPCRDGTEAMEALNKSSFDAIVSDISLPRFNGIELLRAVRRTDLDVPVILITGAPSLESAVEAVELGAFKYLMKPVEPEELVKTTMRAVQLYQLAMAKQEAMSLLGGWRGRTSDRIGLGDALSRSIDLLWPAFQPIIRASDHSLFGYEALLRSDEPSLPHPGAILDAAERLGRLNLLGRTMRERACVGLRNADDSSLLFLNLHPQDLLDPELVNPSSSVCACASQIVLEVTERTTLDKIPNVQQRVACLREAGYRIAVDDLGAGYAGLNSFVLLEPEFVKLDMALVRDVDKSQIKQRLVRSLASVSNDMGLVVVAEGVETAEERDVLVGLGCELLQGYRFGRPKREMSLPSW